MSYQVYVRVVSMDKIYVLMTNVSVLNPSNQNFWGEMKYHSYGIYKSTAYKMRPVQKVTNV